MVLCFPMPNQGRPQKNLPKPDCSLGYPWFSLLLLRFSYIFPELTWPNASEATASDTLSTWDTHVATNRKSCRVCLQFSFCLAEACMALKSFWLVHSQIPVLGEELQEGFWVFTMFSGRFSVHLSDDFLARCLARFFWPDFWPGFWPGTLGSGNTVHTVYSTPGLKEKLLKTTKRIYKRQTLWFSYPFKAFWNPFYSLKKALLRSHWSSRHFFSRYYYLFLVCPS